MAEEETDSVVRGSSSDRDPNFVQATAYCDVVGVTGESSCNKEACNNNEESSTLKSEPAREENLEGADLWMKDGSIAAKDGDYAEAADCYSRALEIRVSHFGELSPHCVSTYYKYGCALLYKSQAEADPLVCMPKKDAVSQEEPNNDSSIKNSVNGESSIAEAVETEVEDNGAEGQDESDDEELADGEEDETDLDLAWKMLDVARAIVEKDSGDTMEKVDILSALAEVALEREDVETSLSDYLKALSMLENLVEPDSRNIAELNFRICLCLEIGSKPEEAIPYCQKAISVCKSRVDRMTNEAKNISEPSTDKLPEEMERATNSLEDTKAEIDTLNGLCEELEKKLEDLQQLISNPRSILSDILGIMSAKARGSDRNDAPSNAAGPSSSNHSATTSQTNGTSNVTTDLGVVGRGVKRVVVSPNAEPDSSKRSCFEQPSATNPKL